MNPDSTPHRISTPYGALYLSIRRARQDHFHEEGRGDVTELVPRIRVASDASFEADPNATDHWTIRARAYAVHNVYYFKDLTHVEYSDGRRGDRWHAEDAPYRGGFRNDRRQPVDFRTATWDLMDKAVTAALDSFAADRPEWGRYSEYLYQRAQEETARMEIVQLESELDRKRGEADAFTCRAQALAVDLPGWCFGLGV